MYCPSCNDEFEPHVTWCGSCNVQLLPEGVEPPPPVPDAHLGRFHAAVARELASMLESQGVSYETVTREGEVELVVPGAERNRLRTEVAQSWPEVLDALPEETAEQLQVEGEQFPGWVDPPLGGWVDREGNLMVDLDHEQEEGMRTIGPMLAIVGGGLLVLTWWADLGVGGGFAGVGLLLMGLLLPR